MHHPFPAWIVVVNWNGASLLPGCLAALERQEPRPRVVVVDNGSSDASRDIVARFEGVEWIPLGANRGFAEACNVGFRRALDAGGTWVGTVNNDVRLDPGWLRQLIEAGRTHPQVGILGGLLVFEDHPDLVNSTGLVLDPLWRARDRDFGTPLASLHTADGPVVAVSGAAALFRADALRRAGLFDPAFFAYCEDLDLCLRAARLGIGSRFVSAARASHGYGRSFGSDSPQRRYLVARNHLRILARHAPWPLAAAVPLLAFLRAALRAPLEALRGRPAFAAAHWRAARDGLSAAALDAWRRGGGLARGMVGWLATHRDRLAWALRRRGLVGAFRRAWRGRGAAPGPALGPGVEARLRRWLRQRPPTAGALRRASRLAARLASRPLVSLVCPVEGSEGAAAAATLASVRAQVYGEWELLLVADARAARELDARAECDARVRLLPPPGTGRAGAVARGLEAARGDCLALLEPGGRLEPHALLELARLFASRPDVDVAYSDEDRFDAEGRRREPILKPGWSPNLLLSANYLGRLCAVRRGLAGDGGFTPGSDGAEDYDLVLRAVERARRVEHLPEVLYHAPPERRPASDGGRRVLEAALERRRIGGLVETVAPGRYRVRYARAGTPLVSICIPTRDRVALLRACLASILERSSYRNVEILVVDNGSREPETLEYLRSLTPPHRALCCPGEFNWSALNNHAAREASGEHLLFLNNDVEVLSPGWIEALLEHSQRPGVGAVGARLLYPDDAVQHAGVALGMEGFAGHPFRGLRPGEPGYQFLASAVRDLSAVTGACMMVPRGAFREAGGFDERLRQVFNDVDFCLRLRGRGFSVVYTPHAVLRHLESASRAGPVPRSDLLLARERWGALAASGDPYDMADLSSAG